MTGTGVLFRVGVGVAMVERLLTGGEERAAWWRRGLLTQLLYPDVSLAACLIRNVSDVSACPSHIVSGSARYSLQNILPCLLKLTIIHQH